MPFYTYIKKLLIIRKCIYLRLFSGDHLIYFAVLFLKDFAIRTHLGRILRLVKATFPRMIESYVIG